MSKPKRQPRGAAGASLKELLKFERLLADLSVRFANVSGDQVELEIEIALKHLLQFLDFDRGSFGEFAANGWVTVICSVARKGVDRYPLGSRATFASWYLGQLSAEKTVAWDPPTPCRRARLAELLSATSKRRRRRDLLRALPNRPAVELKREAVGGINCALIGSLDPDMAGVVDPGS
jgi:hypothetical protein